MTKLLRRAVTPIVICIALSGLTAFLLGSSGPVAESLGEDPSFLVGPIIAFLVLRLGRKLASIVMPGLGGVVLARILSGASFAVVVAIALGETARIPELSDVGLAPLSAAGGYAVLWVTGVTVVGLSDVLGDHKGMRWAKPAVEALGYFLVAGASYAIFELFRETWLLAPSIGLALFAGFAGGAVSALAGYGEYVSNRLVSDICRWLSGSRFRMFFIAALVYSYIALIRPPMAESFPYTPLVEWAIVFFVAWRVYRGIRATLKTSYSTPLKESSWKKHEQETIETVDQRITYLSSIQKEYVELGLKPRLLVNLIATLNENKWDRDKTCLAMIPLINCEDEKVPWYAFLWDQARIQKRNVDRRRKVLDEVLSNINKQPGALPLQKKVEVEA